MLDKAAQRGALHHQVSQAHALRAGACRPWRLLLLASLLLMLGGCASAPGTAGDQSAVKATIVRYNELLSDGYRALNMNPIQEVATSLQAQDEYIHMSSLAEGGVRLDPQLVEIEFVRVSVEATTAEAETRETWDYRHYARADGQLVLEQKGLVYHLAWDLEKQSDGRWLVADVRAISATPTVEPSVTGTITPMMPGQ